MGVPIFVVDAFTSHPFHGNPAAVCLLEKPADPLWMQGVAAEMRHAETAFVVPNGVTFDLRWFTPTVEVDLCGHATLAAAHVLFGCGQVEDDRAIEFQTKSGSLFAQRHHNAIQLDFPSEEPTSQSLPSSIGYANVPAWEGRNRMDWFVHIENPAELRSFSPDLELVRALGLRGLILTSQSDEPGFDFISRFFAPQSGVDEDPVTGSAHAALGPYWSKRLGRPSLRGLQVSARGGEVETRIVGDRVHLIGHAVTVLTGTLQVMD